jgi:hypothetical protein
VLDEPFAGLGWPSVVQVGTLLRGLATQGLAVVVITHQMRAVAEYAARCVVLDGGQVRADGPVQDVLSDIPLLESAALMPPAVVRVGAALRLHGFSGRAVRVDDFVGEYQRVREASLTNASSNRDVLELGDATSGVDQPSSGEAAGPGSEASE